MITPEISSYSQLAFSDFIPGWYALELFDIRPLATPIAAKGDAQLWEWEEESIVESFVNNEPDSL